LLGDKDMKTEEIIEIFDKEIQSNIIKVQCGADRAKHHLCIAAALTDMKKLILQLDAQQSTQKDRPVDENCLLKEIYVRDSLDESWQHAILLAKYDSNSFSYRYSVAQKDPTAEFGYSSVKFSHAKRIHAYDYGDEEA
jgi:hypothetical protein